jgi:hypothetical protein
MYDSNFYHAIKLGTTDFLTSQENLTLSEVNRNCYSIESSTPTTIVSQRRFSVNNAWAARCDLVLTKVDEGKIKAKILSNKICYSVRSVIRMSSKKIAVICLIALALIGVESVMGQSIAVDLGFKAALKVTNTFLAIGISTLGVSLLGKSALEFILSGVYQARAYSSFVFHAYDYQKFTNQEALRKAMR